VTAVQLHYGTTSLLVPQIRKIGLRPDATSRQIWLSRSATVAQSRARQLCRIRGGKPVVAVCEVDFPRLRQLWGQAAIHCRGPMVALRGSLSPSDVVEIRPVADSIQEQAETAPVLTDGEVCQLLDSPSPRVRMMGVLMLATQDSAQAFDWLCTRLRDSDPRVRLALAMALRRRGREVEDVLRGMDKDPDPLVRQAVHDGLQAAVV
jgi:HEAT repeat protein